MGYTLYTPPTQSEGIAMQCKPYLSEKAWKLFMAEKLVNYSGNTAKAYDDQTKYLTGIGIKSPSRVTEGEIRAFCSSVNVLVELGTICHGAIAPIGKLVIGESNMLVAYVFSEYTYDQLRLMTPLVFPVGGTPESVIPIVPKL